MTLSSNGITPEVIRAVMPPYELSTDLLAAMLTAVAAPPPEATMAWRQIRAGRLVHEVAGLMPANAPQARIAAEIVIAREAADGSIARANTPGLAVEQVYRLLRVGSVLWNSAAGLERSLVRHQQTPAPFFGTVLADGIDIAALAAGWGGAGSRPDGGEVPRAGGGASAVGMAGLIPGSTPGTNARGQGLPGTAMTVGAGESGDAAEADRGDSPDAAEGESGDSPAVTVGRRAPAGARRDAGSTPAWTTSRLDQGPGWTLDVVRPRRVDDGAGDGVLRDNAGAAEFRAAERAGGKAASDAAPGRVA
ncbi:MAG TPA: hypothetical protein VN754_10355 [Candidatus Binataceae bacterium]|nr:hypothetical protein [Candidatus Binataceae bacterium]